MVDKKDTKKEPVKVKTGSKKVKESKNQRFLRLGKSRVMSILKAMRILGNCSNRSNYEYSQEQVDSMYATIQQTLDNTYNKFTPSKAEQESFEF